MSERRADERSALPAGGASRWVGRGMTRPVLSRAIDDGLAAGDTVRTVAWSAVLLVVGVFNAWVGIMRHRTMTKVRMDATFRTIRAVVWQAMRLGVSLRRQVAAGEVATIGLSDVQRISQTLTIVGPGVGAVIAYGVIAGLLLSVSPLLAVVVLLGVPVLAVLVGPLLARLHGAEVAYREHHRELTARLGDIVGGLRVLNGIGGCLASATEVWFGDDLIVQRLMANRESRVEAVQAPASATWRCRSRARRPTSDRSVSRRLLARCSSARRMGWPLASAITTSLRLPGLRTLLGGGPSHVRRQQSVRVYSPTAISPTASRRSGRAG